MYHSCCSILNSNLNCNNLSSPLVRTFTRGDKFFELSNHLGNVLVTITDKKLQHSANNTAVDYYLPDVISTQDYYPFGMQMPGRKYSSASYRFGFNGKEKDKEVSATTTYDYGFRIYSPALGRFLSVDPLTGNYPWYTPYQFAGNTPIQAIDLDGLEPVTVHALTPNEYRPKLKPTEWYDIMYKGGGRFYDPTSFKAAAAYNSTILNSDAYSSFRAKSSYYDWAQNEVEKKGIKTKWFAMDATITDPYNVGLTDLAPPMDTKNFLNNIGSIVLKENMRVFNQLTSKGAFNGKSGGVALDRELLYNEQSLIQDYLYSLDIKSLDKYLTQYNTGFKAIQAIKGKDDYLNVASSIIGGNIDFGSIKHRMIIGEVLMYQMNGMKIDDKAKKQIMNDATSDTGRYYKERYGEQK